MTVSLPTLLSRLRLLLLSITIFSAPTLATPINLNPLFDNGLSSWTTSGDASEQAGVVTLGDKNGFGGTLSQVTSAGTGSYLFSFDLFANVAPKSSPLFPGDIFGDVAFGTLYLSDDADAFAGIGAVTAINLFDVSAGLVSSVLTFEPLAGGWNRYSLAFTTNQQFITALFELVDLDFTENSSIALDNVRLEVVPEPVTGLLLGAGLIPLFRRARLARSSLQEKHKQIGS